MALNVWQPEVVRGRHKELVEQSVVPVEFRVHALEMEFRVCKQQILGLEKTYVRSAIGSYSFFFPPINCKECCDDCVCMFSGVRMTRN